MILSLDQGTTSSRAILFDRDAAVRGVAQQEFEQIFPQPGQVEHDPKEIWDSQLATARRVLAENDVSVGEVRAIGITNQRETTVLWDRKTGEPLANAIVWQDRRTAPFCEQLTTDGLAEPIREKTGLVLDPYFSGTKLRWLLDNIDGARARAEAGELAFGTIDTWLIWNLTGGKSHVTDVSNASRTLLFDIHTLDWDQQLLDWIGVPRQVLPEVRSSSEIYGETRTDLFGAPIPIAGIAGDQQAALFGQACHARGQAKITYGTGCFMLMNTGAKAVRSENRLLTTVAWKIGDHVDYALEGSVFVAGAAIQWLRDQLGVIQSAAEVEELAASVPDSGGVVFVPAFAGLGAPHWDPHARGAIFGLTRGASKAHLARAALEAIALQNWEVLEAMQNDSGVELKEVRVDGGASLNNLLMQIQADLLGVPVVRPKIAETTALGAAYLAGLAVGVWDSKEAIAANWAEDSRFEPANESTKDTERRGQALLQQWRAAVERSLEWAKPG